MTTFHFSGVDRAAFWEIIAQEGAAAMVNALIAEQPAMIAAYRRWPEINRVLDSAAFQGNTDLPGYAATIKRVGEFFTWCANLDVIGDQDASDRNWDALQALDVDTLWIYQVRGGESLDYLERRADRHQFVGIGGLVPLLKSDLDKTLRLIEQIGKHLSRVLARAHFFGVSSPAALLEFRDAPWFASTDSQAWLCGFKSFEMIRRDGSRLKTKQAGLLLTRQECAAQNIRQVHSWLNGETTQLAML